MNNGFEQLKINRIKLRAEEFYYYYQVMKELAQELIKGNKLRVSRRVPIMFNQVVFTRDRRCQRLLCGVNVSKPEKNKDGTKVLRFATFFINIHPDFMK